jgi:Mlc titration factor MtfA (ptsG expression regulator)
MFLKWFQTRHRNTILAEPFPTRWDDLLRKGVAHVERLPRELQVKLRRLIQVFVAEKNWEGCRGLTLTEEMKVVIAAQACLLVVGFAEDFYFDHVQSILVYPSGYVAKDVEITRAGVVLEGKQARLGEAWWRGPVILSWIDAKAGGRLESPGRNLVLHEFAHQLDMLNGRTTDGTPPLESRAAAERWAAVMEPEFQTLVQSSEQGIQTLIDWYGATNRAEFFAVATETFFERPRLFRRYHPDIYDLFRDYYRLDPIAWEAEV